jgi:hypothetical protein
MKDNNNADTLMGFAPEPQLKGLGVKLGYEEGKSGPKVRQMRESYNQLPSLAQVMGVIKKEETALSRRVDAVSINALELDPQTGKLRRRGSSKEGIRITKAGFQSLVNRISGAPQGAARYLSSINDREWRSWELARLLKDVPESVKVQVHSWVLNGEVQAYAATSEKYTAYSPNNLLQDLMTRPDLRSTKVQVIHSPLKMTLRLVTDAEVPARDLGAGEAFRAVAVYRTAEDGSSSIKCALEVLRSMCTNLSIVAKVKLGQLRQRHLGNIQNITARVVESGELSEGLDMYLSSYRAATHVNISEEIMPQLFDELTGVNEGRKSRALIQAPGIKPQRLSETLMTQYELEPQPNLVGVHNAITAAAHRNRWPSLAVTDDLQRQAGEVLLQSKMIEATVAQLR